MKTIDTLVQDIYALFDSEDVLISPDEAQEFGTNLAKIISSRVGGPRKGPPTLRMSNVGDDCNRKLWYEINATEGNEKLPPQAKLKFLFGDILEEMLLFLAKKAGHTVEGQQDEMVYEGIVGHRDAVIDGVLVDVKSASTYSFKKFEEGITPQNDAFGYRTQLGLYLEASQTDPKVVEKDKAYWLVIDKTLGNITLSRYDRDPKMSWSTYIKLTRSEVEGSSPPLRSFPAEPEGKGGNMALGVKCSYCPAKHQCWPDLRTFLYSTGPKFFTKVVVEPKVPEVK